MRILFASIFLLVAAFLGAAQNPPPMGRGTELPVLTDPGGWYYHEGEKALYWWTGDLWRTVKREAYDDFTMCNYFLYGHQGEEADVFYARSGRTITNDVAGVICSDSLEGFWSSIFVWMRHADGRDLVLRMGETGDCTRHLRWDTLQGVRGLCLPETFEGDGPFGCAELHNWGILGVNGKWIIPPQFDQPFTFRNGKAFVYLKGKYMVINDKGEFLN